MSDPPYIWRIGLTGGIGAGKSTVAKIFEVLDIPVYYADPAARRLMEEDPALASRIKSLLGREAYRQDGSLDRAWVASQVFSDMILLNRLNGIVHPVVGKDSEQWHQGQSKVPYTLKEAALVFESGDFLHLDAVICVEAPEEVRIARVMQRDEVTREQVLARMDHQWPESRRQMMADYHITNDGLAPLIPQIRQIHHKLSRPPDRPKKTSG